MLTRATTSQAFGKYAAHIHYLTAGGSGGNDPSRYPWNMKSLHELDAVVPSVARATGSRRTAAAGDELLLFPFQCPIWKHTFCTEKAVHGHMRCHWERGWHGMEPPRTPNRGELGADGQLHHRYVCDRCRAPFETKQGLGGHRASHGGKRGCSWLAKQELTQAAAAAEALKPVVFDFDLNKSAPEAQEEEEEE